MKKWIMAVIGIALLTAICLVAVACNGEPLSPGAQNQAEVDFGVVYAYAEEAGFTGTMEELKAIFKGDSAYKLAVEKGYQGSEEEWLESLKGAAGNDGVTPHIGENKHWYIGEVDTGVLAEGVKGDKGDPGDKGDNGRGIKRAYVNDEGYIVVVYTDDQEDVLDQVTEPHPHAIKETIIVECEASCTAEGKTLLICETCGELLKTIVTPRLPHDDEISLVPPTCTEQGYTAHTCKVCGRVEKDAFVNATGHAYADEWEYDATYHWHPVTCGHEDAIVKEVHPLYNNACAICGYNSSDYFLEYQKIKDKEEYAVTGCRHQDEVFSLILPYTYNGLPVTAIADDAFAYCKKLVSVSLGEGITSIGKYAFTGCTALTSFKVPSTVTSIDTNAFNGCYRLTEIWNTSALPITAGESSYGAIAQRAKRVYSGDYDPKTQITPDGFVYYRDGDDVILISYLYDAESIAIPADVTEIGDHALRERRDLKSVTFAKDCKVTRIGEYAFTNCRKLTSIIIPASVTTIETAAFSACYALTEVCSLSSITITKGSTTNGSVAYYAKRLIYYSDEYDSNLIYTDDGFVLYASGDSLALIAYNGTAKEIEVPQGVTEIAAYAFRDQPIVKITMPNTLTTIGKCAFQYCPSLTSVTIPSGVTEIPDWLFYHCESLTSVTLLGSVTSIGDCAFNYCASLTSFTIPNTVTNIGSSAFEYCSGLTSITIPSSVRTLGAYAFSACANLTSLTIENGLATIGQSAFQGSSSLTTLELPSSIRTIGDNAFRRSGLKRIIIKPGTNLIGKYAFANCHDLSYVELPGTVTEIDNYAFTSCDSLLSVSIPKSVLSIKDYAFYQCAGLISVDLAVGVKTIGESAFQGCSALPTVYVPGSVTSIGRGAFLECSSLSSISLPFIGEKADGSGATHFSYIFGAESYTVTAVLFVPHSLRKVTLYGNATAIPAHAFYRCLELTEIALPSGVQIIGEQAFYQCAALKTISLGISLQTVKAYAFYGCSSLTDVTFPSTLTTIEQRAFEGCTSLRVISFPASLTTIGIYAFSGCTSLTHVFFAPSAPILAIDNYTFIGCDSLTYIMLPFSLQYIGVRAFHGCYALVSINYTGLKTAWSEIVKCTEWNNTQGAYIVYCADAVLVYPDPDAVT